jgi:hypothetical protein
MRADDLVAGHAGAGGVPQRERRDAVGVEQVGRALELGEPGQEVTRLVEARVLRLQVDFSIALDDDRVRRIYLHSRTMSCPGRGRLAGVPA